jgi:hypothetical protein
MPLDAEASDRALPWWKSKLVATVCAGMFSVSAVVIQYIGKQNEHQVLRLQAREKLRFDYLDLLTRAGKSLPDRISFMRFVDSTSEEVVMKQWAHQELSELQAERQRAEKELHELQARAASPAPESREQAARINSLIEQRTESISRGGANRMPAAAH